MIIKTHYKPAISRKKRFTQKSVTVPDQTLSLKTLVNKYVKGLPIQAPLYEGIYTDDDLATDFSKLDLADQEERVLKASDELTQIKTTLNEEKQRKAQEEAKKRQELQNKVDDLTQQLTKAQTTPASINLT